MQPSNPRRNFDLILRGFQPLDSVTEITAQTFAARGKRCSLDSRLCAISGLRQSQALGSHARRASSRVSAAEACGKTRLDRVEFAGIPRFTESVSDFARRLCAMHAFSHTPPSIMTPSCTFQIPTVRPKRRAVSTAMFGRSSCCGDCFAAAWEYPRAGRGSQGSKRALQFPFGDGLNRRKDNVTKWQGVTGKNADSRGSSSWPLGRLVRHLLRPLESATDNRLNRGSLAGGAESTRQPAS